MGKSVLKNANGDRYISARTLSDHLVLGTTFIRKLESEGVLQRTRKVSTSTRRGWRISGTCTASGGNHRRSTRPPPSWLRLAPIGRGYDRRSG